MANMLRNNNMPGLGGDHREVLAIWTVVALSEQKSIKGTVPQRRAGMMGSFPLPASVRYGGGGTSTALPVLASTSKWQKDSSPDGRVKTVRTR